MSDKIDENALIQCAKCECLILSDSSNSANDKCVRPKKPPVNNSIDKSSTGAFIFNPRSNSNIKVVVTKASEDESIDKSTSSSERDNRLEAETDDDMKHVCFQFFRKKKKANGHDEATQKSKPELASANTQIKTQMSDAAVGDFVKTTLEKTSTSQGGNNNTIIFQRDPASGDGMACLEHWLRMEAKSNSRNLEDILSELHKQRREIHELKEMLDTVVRALRDQLFMTAFGKTKNGLFTDYGRNTNLERKSNSLSMTQSGEGEIKSTKATTVSAEPPKNPQRKKRRFCPWCK